MAGGSKGMRGRGQGGFTLVEVLVANAVVAIALLGVYGLFRRVLEVEAATTRRWEGQAAAEAVVEHLATAMGNLVNLPGEAAIVAEAEGEEVVAVSCFTQTPMNWNVPKRHAGVNRRRYEGQGGPIVVRVLTYGGTKNLTPGAMEEEPGDAAAWSQATPREIARNVDALSLEFRKADDPNSAWQSRGSWQAGQVVARIRVKVGDQVIERFVWPRANAACVAVSEQ